MTKGTQYVPRPGKNEDGPAPQKSKAGVFNTLAFAGTIGLHMVSGIVELLSLSPKINAAYFSAAFRSLFICMVYKREAGEEYFDETLKLLIRGLVLQLMG